MWQGRASWTLLLPWAILAILSTASVATANEELTRGFDRSQSSDMEPDVLSRTSRSVKFLSVLHGSKRRLQADLKPYSVLKSKPRLWLKSAES